MELAFDTKIVLLLAGLILLWALVLGVWKYQQMAMSETGQAHAYVDIAHRASLMYAFATLILAALVQFSAWSTAVDLIAALVVIFFFVGAIAIYTVHGILRDTDNQFVHPIRGTHAFMFALVAGEIGGLVVILAGFVKAQFLS